MEIVVTERKELTELEKQLAQLDALLARLSEAITTLEEEMHNDNIVSEKGKGSGTGQG